MELQQGTRLEQKLQLSQSQIQSLEILAMDNVSLNDFLQNEYLENPILDHTPVNDMPADFESFPSWMEQHYKPGIYEKRTAGQEDDGRREFIAADENSLAEYIQSQLPPGLYNKQEQTLIDYMIQCLDDHGFFTMDPKEVARLNRVPLEMVTQCLEDLRQLEPWGIFAADLSGCLLRQLEVQGINDPVLETILKDHLQDIADGNVGAISRKLHLSTADTRKYISFIQKLEPRPLQGFQTAPTTYLIPDVIFSYKDDQWEITLNEKWMGDYSLNDYYLRMMGNVHDQELYDYFKRAAERARFIMNSLDQRRHTMLSIASAVLEFQKGYFEGQESLKPMTMNQIAEQLDIHTSTVSRGIKDKYIQFPKGTILMKQLFSSGVSQEGDSTGLTPQTVKSLLQKLIQEEDKSRPYSDQSLVSLLEKQNVHISRRTVTKYREELGIKKSFERKDF